MGPTPLASLCVYFLAIRRMSSMEEKMRLWVRTELLCIHFDAWKVALDTWPIPFVEFKAILVDKVLEHIRESRCIFVQEDLHNVRSDPTEIAHVLDRKCKFFVQRGASKAEEIKDLDVLDYDDDVYVSVCDWSGYDTTEVTSEESEDENTGAFEQSLVEGEEILLVFVSNPFSYSQNENSHNKILNKMFYRVREKSSQNKKGCDWLSVDSPLLKMRQSQNRIHSNVSACVVSCLFFPRKVRNIMASAIANKSVSAHSSPNTSPNSDEYMEGME